MTESPYGTIIASPDGVITDAQGNVWSIQNGQVVENGVPDPTTRNVIALAYAETGYVLGPNNLPQYHYGQVWQYTTSHLWWAATDAGWSPPNGARGVSIPFSPDGTVVTPSNPVAILDSSENVWSIIGGQVAKNGVLDSSTANVIALEYKNGVVWQENADQLWWSYSQAFYYGPSIWTPGTVPVDRSWIGGGDDNASNPNDWSPAGAPVAGDRLTMTSGTVNVYGNDLAGDTLTIPNYASTPTINLIAADASIAAREGPTTININASGGTSNLTLGVLQSTVNIQVAPCSTLVMHGPVDLSNLTVSGGTIKFFGDNLFDSFKTVFNDRLVGTATITESASSSSSELMEVNGFVGCGLTFSLRSYLNPSYGPRDVGLQIDHPESFHGTINRMDGFVAFMGLHATRGEILNGMLELFDCDTLVNKTRFTGNPNGTSDALQLQQNSAGVMFSNSYGDSYQPGGIGTALPLTIQS